jgi:hypothetical protein
VAQLKSLREVCLGLASCESPLKHLGLGETPKRSTLAYANEHRPWELYQTIFNQLLEKSQAEVSARGGRKKFRFKNKLVSLDGSIIDLSVYVLVAIVRKRLLPCRSSSVCIFTAPFWRRNFAHA